MKISRKADYALRAVAYASKLKDNKLASIGRIAKAQSIPREFLAKILKELTKYGILVSFQGVNGGYRLARPPKEITFLDVIEAMDGPVRINLCVGEEPCMCDNVKSCVVRPFFVRQQKQIVDALSAQNFALGAKK